MPHEPRNRQTLIALRARRQAHRLASDLLYPSVEPHRYFCQHCGQAVDSEMLDVNDHLRCAACGRRTRLPAGVALALREYLAGRIDPYWKAPAPPARLADAALWVYLLIAVLVGFATLL